MTVFANTLQTPSNDGIQYCLNMPVPAAEGDLANLNPQPNAPESAPISVLFESAFMAVVQFAFQGSVPAGTTTYVVMQTDLGDGVWIDVAWCVMTQTSGPVQPFCLSAGIAGANAFQTRASGTAPGSNGSNQIALGGRIRFVGKSAPSSSSSSSSSASSGAIAAAVLCSIKVKGLGLR